jgi:hypothetical protein
VERNANLDQALAGCSSLQGTTVKLRNGEISEMIE